MAVGARAGAASPGLNAKEIIEQSLDERRLILTRDLGILKDGRVTHGYWLRTDDPLTQEEEVVRMFHLGRLIAPYTRCLECNGKSLGVLSLLWLC